jgi:hypothetical protein
MQASLTHTTVNQITRYLVNTLLDRVQLFVSLAVRGVRLLGVVMFYFVSSCRWLFL